jgi:hypothetical protein
MDVMYSSAAASAALISMMLSMFCDWAKSTGLWSQGVNAGEWKCKVTAKPEGANRELGVAVVVIRDSELFLVTVEWEDTK